MKHSSKILNRPLQEIFLNNSCFCCCLNTKLYLAFCKPMYCNLPGSSVHGISKARVLEWVAIFQGIFLTQGLNPRLLHWQADSLPLSPQGSPNVRQTRSFLAHNTLSLPYSAHLRYSKSKVWEGRGGFFRTPS